MTKPHKPEVAPKPPRGYELISWPGEYNSNPILEGDIVFETNGRKWKPSEAKGVPLNSLGKLDLYYARRIANPTHKKSLSVPKVQPVTKAEVRSQDNPKTTAAARRTAKYLLDRMPVMGDYEAGVQYGREQIQDAARKLVRELNLELQRSKGELCSHCFVECIKKVESALKLKG